MTTKREQAVILENDIKNVLTQKRWINKRTNNDLDRKRILGILAIKNGAEKYLAYTIPKIIDQITETGLNADIIIGANNGFECPVVLGSFGLITNTQLIHLYTTERIDTTVPSIIFDNAQLNGKPYRIENIPQGQNSNRIFFIHQKEGIHAPGKIRILMDIYQLLLDSIACGWIPPALTLVFDAESLFLVDSGDDQLDLESNGLRLLIEKFKKDTNIDILGAKVHNAVYNKQAIIYGNECLLPDFSRLVPPIQFFINLVHGRYKRYSWKPGGGTIGKTDLMISLLIVISKGYPNTKNEDSHATILAQHAGYYGGICTEVVAVNRCPDIVDLTADEPAESAWMKQMSRWISSRYELEMNYGRDKISVIAGYNLLWDIIIGAWEFFKGFIKNKRQRNLFSAIKKSLRLLNAACVAKKIKKDALNYINIINMPNTKAFW